MFVVIPAYKEKFSVVKRTLESLNIAAKNYDKKVSVLVLVNWNARDDQNTIELSYDLHSNLVELELEYCHFKVFKNELSGKKSGVGMARKILMDTAFRNMLQFGIDGLIINLDADTAVSGNYFTEIDKQFLLHPRCEAASIAFEHIDDSNNNDSITAYELHLRCFVNMQRLLKLPFAYQTVGSAMVVRRDAYAKEGGMVKRQAGEDFYFLHKYSKNQTLFDINTTCVFPSSRGSDRVPFGTGKAVNDLNDFGAHSSTTYNTKSFIVLEEWLIKIHNKAKVKLEYKEDWAKSDDSFLNKFLESIEAQVNIKQIVENVTNYEAFKKRFYNWFDAFTLMKYLHYVRDLGYADIPIDEACDFLFEQLKLNNNPNRNEKLKTLRSYDLNNVYHY